MTAKDYSRQLPSIEEKMHAELEEASEWLQGNDTLEVMNAIHALTSMRARSAKRVELENSEFRRIPSLRCR